MRNRQVFWVALAAIGLLCLGVGSARADDCLALTGSPPSVTECTLSTAVVKSGTFTLGETLHITSTGSITTNGADLTLHITGGNFVMEDKALIDASNAGGTGGKITVTLDNGDVDLKPGSIIRSNGLSGGEIDITTSN